MAQREPIKFTMLQGPWGSVLQMIHTYWVRHSELVAVALLITFALNCFNANLLVIFLKRCKIFACFRKLTLLHAFSDIPMNKCALRVHQVEFMVNARKNF